MMKPVTNSLGLSVTGTSKERRVPYLDAVFGPSGVLVPDRAALANKIDALANAGGGIFALRVGAETEYTLAELVDRLDEVQHHVIDASDNGVRPEPFFSTEKYLADVAGLGRSAFVRVVVGHCGVRHQGSGEARLFADPKKLVVMAVAV
jgi:hypothetical protein